MGTLSIMRHKLNVQAIMVNLLSFLVKVAKFGEMKKYHVRLISSFIFLAVLQIIKKIQFCPNYTSMKDNIDNNCIIFNEIVRYIGRYIGHFKDKPINNNKKTVSFILPSI